MYLPLSSTTPIFVGGMLRWLADRRHGKSQSEAETETDSGVLLSSGYIAGGTLIGLVVAFFVFLPKAFNDALDLAPWLGEAWNAPDSPYPKVAALAAFVVLVAILLRIALRKETDDAPLAANDV